MIITNYENLFGESMVYIVNEEENWTESMPLTIYEQRLKDEKKQSGTL